MAFFTGCSAMKSGLRHLRIQATNPLFMPGNAATAMAAQLRTMHLH